MGADILGVLIAAVVVFFLVRVALNTEARAERYRANGIPKRPTTPARTSTPPTQPSHQLSPQAVRANRAAWLAAQRRQGR